MDQRINYSKVAPEGIRALGGLETYLRSSGLEPDLLNPFIRHLGSAIFAVPPGASEGGFVGETLLG